VRIVISNLCDLVSFWRDRVLTTKSQRHKGRMKKIIDAFTLLFYYRLNTGKEVIQKHMSLNHSEVAET
jgi:hypothetical protein